jgi:hypothetical protein
MSHMRRIHESYDEEAEKGRHDTKQRLIDLE